MADNNFFSGADDFGLLAPGDSSEWCGEPDNDSSVSAGDDSGTQREIWERLIGHGDGSDADGRAVCDDTAGWAERLVSDGELLDTNFGKDGER